MKVILMSLCVLMVVLLAMIGETHAWRPQGRFGKRRLSEELDIPQHLQGETTLIHISHRKV